MCHMYVIFKLYLQQAYSSLLFIFIKTTEATYQTNLKSILNKKFNKKIIIRVTAPFYVKVLNGQFSVYISSTINISGKHRKCWFI